MKRLAATSAAFILPAKGRSANCLSALAGPNDDIEIQVASVSEHTLRLSILPAKNGHAGSIPFNGSLVRTAWDPPIAKLHGGAQAQTIKLGSMTLKFSPDPLTFTLATASGETVQTLTWDRESGAVGFTTGNSPLLGLGEGGPQFDRRGSIDSMISGQGGYKLATHGGRVPIPWIIGTSGWAMFFNQPFGTFDFTGPRASSCRQARTLLCPSISSAPLPETPRQSWPNTPV